MTTWLEPAESSPCPLLLWAPPTTAAGSPSAGPTTTAFCSPFVLVRGRTYWGDPEGETPRPVLCAVKRGGQAPLPSRPLPLERRLTQRVNQVPSILHPARPGQEREDGIIYVKSRKGSRHKEPFVCLPSIKGLRPLPSQTHQKCK